MKKMKKMKKLIPVRIPQMLLYLFVGKRSSKCCNYTETPLSMEQFNMRIKQIGIPLTLSSIGRNYVLEEWRTNFPKYLPYQISGKILTGNDD